MKKPTLPAVAPSNGALTVANWPTQGQVKDEAWALDRMIKVTKRMVSALERLKQSPSQKSLAKAVEARDYFERGDTKRLAMARSDEDNWIDPLEPPDWRDEEWCVQKSQVSIMLAIFMGSFPTSNVKQPQIFTKQLLDDVMEREPSYAVLESTCRELRTTLKFMPSIAEFVGELDKQRKQWSEREDAHWLAIETYDELVAQIPATETQLATEQAEREEQRRIAAEKKRADDELRAQPLKVGDRVRGCGKVSHAGPGTIEKINKESWFEFTVMLDTACQHAFRPDQLVRLIPGDAGFELTDAKRAEIAQKVAEHHRSIADQRAAIERQRAERLLARGDRVFAVHFAAHGTVVDRAGDVYTVRFDNGDEEDVHREHLERRFPGWDDFA